MLGPVRVYRWHCFHASAVEMLPEHQLGVFLRPRARFASACDAPRPTPRAPRAVPMSPSRPPTNARASRQRARLAASSVASVG